MTAAAVEADGRILLAGDIVIPNLPSVRPTSSFLAIVSSSGEPELVELPGRYRATAVAARGFNRFVAGITADGTGALFVVRLDAQGKLRTPVELSPVAGESRVLAVSVGGSGEIFVVTQRAARVLSAELELLRTIEFDEPVEAADAEDGRVYTASAGWITQWTASGRSWRKPSHGTVLGISAQDDLVTVAGKRGAPALAVTARYLPCQEGRQTCPFCPEQRQAYFYQDSGFFQVLDREGQLRFGARLPYSVSRANLSGDGSLALATLDDASRFHGRILAVRTGDANPTGIYGDCLASGAREERLLRPYELSPGMVAAFFGKDLAAGELASYRLGPEGRIATEFEGTRVLVAGRPAPLLAAGPERIRFVVPYETGLGPARVCVQRGGSESCLQAIVKAESPELLRRPDGSLVVNADGTPNTRSNPARLDEWVTVRLTGSGLLASGNVTGAIAGTPPPLGQTPRLVQFYWNRPVQCPNCPSTPAEFQFSAVASEPLGVEQLRLRAPAGTRRPPDGQGRFDLNLAQGASVTIPVYF